MGKSITTMHERPRQSLRQVVVAQYDVLVRRLARRLGSADLADDVLHDAWLRLEREPDPASVRDPIAYVLRTASNLAANVRVRDQRRAALLGGNILQGQAEDVADAAPDPEQIAIARSELAAIKRALAELPERRQAIAVAAWTETVTFSELADRYGVSVRTIQHEVQLALLHCADRVERK